MVLKQWHFISSLLVPPNNLLGMNISVLSLAQNCGQFELSILGLRGHKLDICALIILLSCLNKCCDNFRSQLTFLKQVITLSRLLLSCLTLV